ncbi:MAG: tyrosine-type recombinase/integrase [Acidimicrobiales bacterium]
MDETVAELLRAAADVTPATRASYERRWRMWQAFADHYGVPTLPADPANVAAFVVARHAAGVSREGVAANLSAISWFHAKFEPGADDVAAGARTVLRAMSRDGGASPRRPAPVLSVGALMAMAGALPAMGLKFAAKVVRSSLPAVRPRQLGTVTASDVSWGPAGAWVELALPAMPLVGKHPALAPATVRLVADPGWVACPVRALRQLAAVAGEGPLLNLRQLNQAHLASFNPSTAPDGVGARLQVRDAAIVCVGYAGALRVEELAWARLEHIDVIDEGYRLRIPGAKTSRSMPDQAVILDGRDDMLDPVAALDRWLAVRGDDDGPLFTALHHRAPGRLAEGAHMPAGDLREVIHDLAVRVGLPETVSGYSLRRSWATHRYLADPNDLGPVSLQLRHASIDMTVRYVEDLRTHHLDGNDMLSPDRAMAGPGGQPTGRKDLGFGDTPLVELVDQARLLQAPRAAKAPSTRRIEDSHWNTWRAFANAQGWPAEPTSPEALALYFASRADKGLKASSLRAQLATIVGRHAEAGHPTSGLGEMAEEILDAYSRSSTRTTRKAPILGLAGLAAMVEVTGWALPEGLRDRVIVCVGYGGAMRADDLSRARLEDIEVTPWGCVLRLRTAKDDPTGQTGETVVLLRRRDSLDPVAAIDDLIGAVGAPVGPLVPVHVGADRAMSAEGIGDRVRCLAKAAGLRTVPTGHSLRRSWSTHAYEAGVDLVSIQRHLRHSSPTTTKGYVESLSAWVDNPAATLADRLLAPAMPTTMPASRKQEQR